MGKQKVSQGGRRTVSSRKEPVGRPVAEPLGGAPEELDPARRTKRYLTGLDGLRAIAVVSVMLYHFDTGLVGGYLGVDVFFVLSGYLITSQLLTRWADGAVDLVSFWTGRIRRLFPAVAALIIGVSVAMLALDRAGIRTFLGDVAAAATYTSNWWYVLHERSYFEAAGRPPALQHLWSLAVEEQFYLLWPLVVAGLTFAFTTRGPRRWALFVLSLVGAVLSALWMHTGTAAADLPATGDPSRFYFGTDSHAMGLLAGAALAAWRNGAGFSSSVPPLRPAGLVWTVLGFTGLGGLAWFFVTQSDQSEWMYRYGFAAMAGLVVVLVIAASRPGPTEWLLSLPFMRYLGTRSYSLYLWHWPVAVFTRPGADLEWSEPAVMALRWGLTLALAEASYRLVENPVRRLGIRDSWRHLRTRGWGLINPATGLVALVTGLAVAQGAVAWTTDPEEVQEQQVAEVLGDAEVGVATDAPSGTSGGPGESAPPSSAHPTARPSGSGSPDPSASGSPTSPDASAEPTESGPTTSRGGACDPTRLTGDRVMNPDDAKWLGESQLPVDTLPVPSDGLRLDDATQCMDITVFGDSVPLSTGPIISRAFGVLDLRASVGIQSKQVLQLAQEAVAAGEVDSPVVMIHTGNNGPIRGEDLVDAANSLAEQKGVEHVLLVRPFSTGSWDAQNQKTFDELGDRGLDEKVEIVDWRAAAEGQENWFLEDGVHPDYIGKMHYVHLLQEAITQD
ncbi:Peptidoglycan/LPS O-acetylase OafA/YrhL, contains acyltransferase and SGNH-hydrolase domains [Kytococcus aerolatus]|uniref:Peptidoglycan/LPS O-acetylase OafA/YrhL, contains acyltransferase and SGNH-hydrolase domains n=1 Tax=Kytococcus aerolatus TaxID=592308 RepID=A0A212U1S2_9MICO|nr:acyltransferase family protein [Kytococcus aerolatus]SNC72090.1 Peptidoglycan/LPS O-acetylase OafA/YrhL, contains acyltransferase and SGNH-hydrolase domains [Kytococcus aerolatus]